MTCSHADLDGAYVLGALSADERLAYERHLPSCPTCSRAVRELAGLPGLLAQVPTDVVESLDELTPLPDTLLAGLVREVRRGERRRRTVTWLAAAAAAVVVGGGAAAVVVHDGDAPDSRASAAGATAPARAMAPTAADGGSLEASLSLTPVAWGTRLDLTCRYATAADDHYPHASSTGSTTSTYTLVVRATGGAEEQVATWRAVPGRTLHLSGATAWTAGDIDRIEVRAADGTPVLSLAG